MFIRIVRAMITLPLIILLTACGATSNQGGGTSLPIEQEPVRAVNFDLKDFYQKEFVISDSEPEHYPFRKRQDRAAVTDVVITYDLQEIHLKVNESKQYSVNVPVNTKSFSIALYAENKIYPMFTGYQISPSGENLEFEIIFQDVRYVESYLHMSYSPSIKDCLSKWDTESIIEYTNVDFWSEDHGYYQKAIACYLDGYVRLIQVVKNSGIYSVSDDWDLTKLPNGIFLTEDNGYYAFYNANISEAKFGNTTSSITLY